MAQGESSGRTSELPVGVWRAWEDLKYPRPPEWTCELWEDLAELKGVYICAHHGRAMDIVALDRVSRLCRVGAQRDSFEFLAMLNRDMQARGIPTRPLTFWERD